MKNLIYIALVLIGFSARSQERFSVELANFNSEVSDFGPSYTEKGLIFASERDSGNVAHVRHRIKGKLRPFLQLFSVKENDSLPAKRLKNFVNKKYHESTVAITNDGNTMYFTRNNYYNGKFRTDEKGMNRLKLFRATKKNNIWEGIIELPFNSDNYSVAHPTLNADNSRLYFASDMEGTLGLSDIFYVDLLEDGTYSVPVNMGGSINTEGNDTFPFMSKSGDLYLASDGHQGAGGLDIFVSPKSENYTTVYNLGAPLNGGFDDFALIFNETDRTGYFSSNRVDGVGDDDIYKFKELSPLVINCEGIISGIVKDENRDAIINAEVVLTDASGNEINRIQSDSKGVYQFVIDCNKDTFVVKANKKSYEDDSKTVETSLENKDAKANLVLQKRRVDLAKELNLKPIYFDLDKSNIRPDAVLELQKVIDYLNSYPNVKINVRSHTDSRANDFYNMKLSDRRAKSTAKYIIEKGGISKDRISRQGLGETQLINKCSNGVKCSKAEHQINRRSEFIVIAN